MLIVTGEQITECSIPTSSPKLTVVVDLTKLGALVGVGGEGVEDGVLLHLAGAQADVLAGVLLAQATESAVATQDNGSCGVSANNQQILSKDIFLSNFYQYLDIRRKKKM